MNDLERQLPLGKPTDYPADYDPSLLCPIPRRIKREELGLVEPLPFQGFDLWNAYELSWLTPRGKPVVAMGEFRIPCSSDYMIESKSLKLYLNSFNQTRFDDMESVCTLLRQDLTNATGAPVDVHLTGAAEVGAWQVRSLPGHCIDDLDLEITQYELQPELLALAVDPGQSVSETLYSHLLKSNCLVTRQPDWASVMVRYRGGRIDAEQLLRYLVSFRRHNEFHEQCVERIFFDLLRYCQPEQLTVYARYTRRGGLDINPFRSNFESQVDNLRLPRQ